jgi:dsDNA-specific endonuclease/ATPase MutS2
VDTCRDLKTPKTSTIICGLNTGEKTVARKALGSAATMVTTHPSRLKTYAAETAEAINAAVQTRAL